MLRKLLKGFINEIVDVIIARLVERLTAEAEGETGQDTTRVESETGGKTE